MKLTILMSAFGDGGVERMVVNTAGGLAARGVDVRFMAGVSEGPYLDRLPPAIEPETLPARGVARLLRVVRHLRYERPDVMLVAKARDARLAIIARRLAGVRVPLVMRPGTAVTERVVLRTPLASRWKLYRLARLYRHADVIVANSAGVRTDIAGLLNIPADRIHLVRNPVITADLHALARQPVDDPWLEDETTPLILGAGGLRRQKDFPTLIRAFARLRRERPARLLILGRGRLERELRALITELGLEDDARLGGFVGNPYPYMARCSLFVLSSRWEGSPNVLTEALALGTPVVSTDCRSGPGEILGGGRFGPLVPVGDDRALAEAMRRTLDGPLPGEVLRDAVAEYTVERNATHYEHLLRHLCGTADD